MQDYYKIKTMDMPSREMYGLADESILVVGTARRLDFGVSIDVDPNSPADIIYNGLNMPFANKSFDIAVLDFVTNFCHPSHVLKLICEANRVAIKVMGRCHIADIPTTLRGPKQCFCHTKVPKNVDWIELRRASCTEQWK